MESYWFPFDIRKKYFSTTNASDFLMHPFFCAFLCMNHEIYTYNFQSETCHSKPECGTSISKYTKIFAEMRTYINREANWKTEGQTDNQKM